MVVQRFTRPLRISDRQDADVAERMNGRSGSDKRIDDRRAIGIGVGGADVDPAPTVAVCSSVGLGAEGPGLNSDVTAGLFDDNVVTDERLNRWLDGACCLAAVEAEPATYAGQ